MWKKIEDLKGKTIHTVRHRKPFQIVDVKNDKCIIKLGSTGKIRPIPKNDFMNTLKLGPVSSLNTSILREKRASEVNPTYVLAILQFISSE